MVGVPGKSKGCDTCRKRKIGCSFERPECMKCVKTNRVCGGYQREAIFVVDQATGDSTAGDLLPRYHVKTYRRAVPRKKSTEVVVPKVARQSNNGNSLNYKPGSPVPARFAPDIEITSPAAFRQQFFCQFLSNFVADVNLHTIRAQIKSEEGAWLVLVPELPDLTKALDTAILALSSVRLGRNNNDKNLILESRRLYVEGLRDLQHALWDPDLMYRDETLAACMALGMYETLECPSGSRGGWVGHSDGCARLVQLRGTKANSEGLGHHLFSSFRQQGILQGMHLRCSTYLSEPAWQKIAWKGRSTGSYDQLLDIMSLLPAIFEDSDRLGSPSPSEMPEIFAILDRCWAVDSLLEKFFSDLQSTCDGPIYWNLLSTLEIGPSQGDGEKLFPVAFHFKDLSTAFTTNMYWMACILTFRTLMELYGRIMKFAQIYSTSPQTTPPPTTSSTTTPPIKTEPSPSNIPPSPFAAYMSKLRPLKHRKDLVGIAKNIAQTVEFCIQEDKKSQGPGAMMVPLLMATLTFRYSPGCERELEWARAAMDLLADKGWKIARHLEPEGAGYTKKKPQDLSSGNGLV